MDSGDKRVKSRCALERAQNGVTRPYRNMVEVDFSLSGFPHTRKPELLVEQDDALGWSFPITLAIPCTICGLNKDLYIVVRTDEEGSEQKLVRAGANRVSSPYLTGGTQVAQVRHRPHVIEFLELATKSEHLDLQIEEIPIQSGSRFDGTTPCECGLDGGSESDRGRRQTAVRASGVQPRIQG